MSDNTDQQAVPSLVVEDVESPNSGNLGEVHQATLGETQSIDSGAEKNPPASEQNGSDETQDPNTLAILPLLTSGLFATPSKSLPPLKDIENITTPKAFSVARDHPELSPVVRNDATNANDTLDESHANGLELEESHEVVASFLGVPVPQLNSEVLAALHARANEFVALQSEVSFLKVNQEHAASVQEKKIALISKKVDRLTAANNDLTKKNEELLNSRSTETSLVTKLQEDNSTLSQKLAVAEHQISESNLAHNTSIALRDHEIRKLNEANHRLTQSSIDISLKLNEVSKELNAANSEKFSLKLELSKATNELAYEKNQKLWFEQELASVRDRYTDLIKKHEAEYLTSSNKITALQARVSSLERVNADTTGQLDDATVRIEKLVSKLSQLENTLEVEKVRFAKELSHRDELVQVTNVQSKERLDRITQLELYVDEIKTSLGDNITQLTDELSKKVDRVVYLEEKLARTEEVLQSELEKDSALPRLDQSASMILSSGEGISLSELYTEFNHLKKQLVLERSQKEKLTSQLQAFVTELESKKPAIASYRDQVAFYENSLQEMIGKVETIRIEKAECLKEAQRLRSRLADNEQEVVQLKQLSKDLGKQLCYYLIHSKIRDDNEDPILAAERRAIEAILAKSGNTNDIESEADGLISERLVGFASIIDLQAKNENLLLAVRQLTKQLEAKDSESQLFEASAIEEAKDAIITLQSELDSMVLKYDAVVKERDLLKSTDRPNGGESKVLTSLNEDLKKKLDESEAVLKDLQAQSSARVKDLNDKLAEVRQERDELRIQVSSTKHSVQLTESRLENTKKTLDNANAELQHLRSDIAFWKQQVSKHETVLVSKSNELRDVEAKAHADAASLASVKSQLELATATAKELREEIAQLRIDKANLNEYLQSMQSFVSEKDTFVQELRQRAQELETQYATLKQDVNDKEERIRILTNQTELAISAQNAKLEQVNQLSQQLLEAKTKLLEKQRHADNLAAKLAQHEAAPTTKDVSILSSDGDVAALKRDLLASQEQVVEFTKIAQGAEEALRNATASFEQYRDQQKHREEELVTQAEVLRADVAALNATNKSLTAELGEAQARGAAQADELRAQLEQFRAKADAYDQLKADSDAKLSALLGDLQAQQDIASSNQARYQSTLEENDQLTKQTASLKEERELEEKKLRELEELLRATKQQLAERDDALAAEKDSLAEEMESWKAKAMDLQNQYTIVLNQLELTKGSGNAEGDDSDLREVILYLRRAKELADAAAIVAKDERMGAEKQLASVRVELQATKAQLTRLHQTEELLELANAEHNRVLEQLQQLNILRESNTTLRNENQSLLAKVKALEESASKPVEQVVKDDDTVSALSQQVRLLTEENERLKTQLSSNEEVTAMMTRFENLKSEFRTKLSALRGKNKELEKQIGDDGKKYADAEAIKAEALERVEVLTKEKQQLEARILAIGESKSDEEVTSLKEQLAVAQRAKQQLESKAAEEIKRAVDEQRQKLEADFAAKAPVSANDADHEAVVAAIKKEFEDKLAMEKNSIEKKNEFKVRVLTRKIEKLEAQVAKDAKQPAPAAQNAKSQKPKGQQPTAQSGQTTGQTNNKKGKGAPFESTLSVHRPQIDRPKNDKKRGGGAHDGSAAKKPST